MSFDISAHPKLKDWAEEHEQLLSAISFTYASSEPGPSREEYISQLNTLIKFVRVEKETAMKSLSQEIGANRVTDRPRPIYGDARQNMLMRKYVFTARWFQELKMHYFSNTLNIYLEKEQDITNAVRLLDSDIIPEGCVCRISESFFLVSLPPELLRMGYEIEALKALLERLQTEVDALEKPPWVTDFRGWLKRSIIEHASHFDNDTFYIAPLSCEVPLSRAVFGGIAPQVKDDIDRVIEKKGTLPRIKFMQSVLEFCRSMLPDKEDSDEAVRSTCLMVFFRLFFDRFYEKTNGTIIVNTSEEELKILTRIMHTKAGKLALPAKISPDSETPEDLVRDIVRQDVFYRAGVQFFEQVQFCVNPIDMLYNVHKTLLAINKASLLRRAGNVQISTRDLNTLLCFDDLFVLLIAVAVASDVPELFSLGSFVLTYTPAHCLSNAFEYAQAGFESLVTQIREMVNDLDA